MTFKTYIALLCLCGNVLCCNAQQKNPKAPVQKSQTGDVYNAPLKWYTDLITVQQLSNASKKPIFGFFTGSDWCGWCKKLQHDVFEKPEFIQWANKNVILLELDYPRSKQLAPELMKQNQDLQAAFQVRGYPTIHLFFVNDDPATKKKNITSLGSLGYPSGAQPGKEEVAFINTLNQLMQNQKK